MLDCTFMARASDPRRRRRRGSRRRRRRRGRKWGGVPFPSPFPADYGVWRSVVSSPTERGQKRFYCFLSVLEASRSNLSFEHLLKINVIHSRPLVEKKWVCSIGRFWSPLAIPYATGQSLGGGTGEVPWRWKHFSVRTLKKEGPMIFASFSANWLSQWVSFDDACHASCVSLEPVSLNLMLVTVDTTPLDASDCTGRSTHQLNIENVRG